MANTNQSMIIAAAGLAIAIGAAWGLTSNASMHPNRRRRLKPNRWFKKHRVQVAGTEAAQRELLNDAKFFKKLDLLPMQERIDMFNAVLWVAYDRGEIAEPTYNAWKDKLPV